MSKQKKMTGADVATLLFGIAALAFMLRVFGAPAPEPVNAGSRAAHTQRLGVLDGVRVQDGDTVQADLGGDRPPLRLLQINAPEADQCYGRQATARLQRILEGAGRVEVRYDSRLNARRFGRELAYLYADGANVNVRLVRSGHAVPYFIAGERGDHAAALRAALRDAQRNRAGMWSACNNVP